MLNETNIRCFLSLCETLSFTETARRMYLTQQAVSKNIMQLESDFGFPLVNRSGRSITLTVEGSRCQALLRSLMQTYGEGMSRIRGDFDSAHHSLNIGYQIFLDFGASLVRANAEMRARFPDYTLRTVRYAPGTLPKMLYDGSLDLIVLQERFVPENPDFQKKVLFSVYLSIMVSASHPSVSEDATYLDFRTEPYIMDIYPGETEKDVALRGQRECAMCGLEPREYITTPNRESAYTTAELSGGIVLGSDISNISKSLRLMRYRTQVQNNIVCGWKKNCAIPAVERYAELLARTYQDSAQSAP